MGPAQLPAFSWFALRRTRMGFYASEFCNSSIRGGIWISWTTSLTAVIAISAANSSDDFKTEKILSVLASLRDHPEEFDLGIVNEPGNPRHGMWTIAQPQKIVIITKPDFEFQSDV